MVIWQDWVAAAVLFIVSALVRLTFLLWMRGDASLESLISKWDGRIYLAIAKYGYFSDVGARQILRSIRQGSHFSQVIRD